MADSPPIEIFADTVQRVALANGVVRIELTQLRLPADAAKTALAPAVVCHLLIPAGTLKDVVMRLAEALEKISERDKGKQKAMSTLAATRAPSPLDNL